MPSGPRPAGYRATEVSDVAVSVGRRRIFTMARQTPDFGGGGEPRVARGIRGASEGGGKGVRSTRKQESLAVVAFGFAHDALQVGKVGGDTIGVCTNFLLQHSMYNLSFYSTVVQSEHWSPESCALSSFSIWELFPPIRFRHRYWQGFALYLLIIWLANVVYIGVQQTSIGVSSTYTCVGNIPPPTISPRRPSPPANSAAAPSSR